jgi:bis(5'-adenosyl)-triphosphatase
MSAKLLFSKIEVTRQAFYHSSLSYAIVNLRPIVPGRKRTIFQKGSLLLKTFPGPDVLVMPTRAVPRLADLNGAL